MRLAIRRRDGYPLGMTPHPLVALLTGSGVSPAELVRRLAAARPVSVILTAPAVQSWYTGRTVPRDEIRPVIASALGVDLDVMLRACAGIDSADAVAS